MTVSVRLLTEEGSRGFGPRWVSAGRKLSLKWLGPTMGPIIKPTPIYSLTIDFVSAPCGRVILGHGVPLQTYIVAGYVL
jgi:hypothetical protein